MIYEFLCFFWAKYLLRGKKRRAAQMAQYRRFYKWGKTNVELMEWNHPSEFPKGENDDR